MKRINISNFAILVTCAMLFLSFHAFGHSPCQTEQKAVDKVERDLMRIRAEIVSLDGKLLALTTHMLVTNHPVEKDIVKHFNERVDLINKIDTAEEKKKAAKNKLPGARVALAHCRDTSYRKCDCAIHHTQNLTSCDCDIKRWRG